MCFLLTEGSIEEKKSHFLHYDFIRREFFSSYVCRRGELRYYDSKRVRPISAIISFIGFIYAMLLPDKMRYFMS